jgi:selenocysteine-specific elongation factor
MRDDRRARRTEEAVVLARDHWTRRGARRGAGRFSCALARRAGRAGRVALRRMAAPLVSDTVWRAAVDALVDEGRTRAAGRGCICLRMR